MPAVLISVLVWFLGSAIARVLIGAGISIVTVLWIEDELNSLLVTMSAMLHSGAPDLVMILGNGGIWVSLTNIASALVMRVAIVGAANIMGLKRSK